VLKRLLAIIVLCMLTGLPAAAQAEPLLVFAAASTTNAVQKVNQAFTQATGAKVTASFASSGTLAKQIANGAPARVFLSANVKWVDFLQEKGFLEKGTRLDLLANRLVLVVPSDSPLGPVDINRQVDPLKLLKGGWLAMGDPRHVPAGSYAKQALTSLGWWPKLEKRLALAASVRVALMMVERGEAALGIVYATDAKISKKVKVVGVFPPDTHNPIVYPAALVAGQVTPEAQRYLEFLQTPEARKIFASFGFEAAPGK